MEEPMSDVDDIVQRLADTVYQTNELELDALARQIVGCTQQELAEYDMLTDHIRRTQPTLTKLIEIRYEYYWAIRSMLLMKLLSKVIDRQATYKNLILNGQRVDL
jgi:hypothetical protein